MNYLYFGALNGSYEEIKSQIEKEVNMPMEDSPDVHIFSSEGNATFGVEVAGRIEEVINDYPIGEKHYVIISDFSRLTVDAQNMLLKPLEDGRLVDFYLASSSENVLATIKSRCKCIRLHRSFEEFAKLYHGENAREVYYITDGDLDDPDSELIGIFLDVKRAFEEGQQENLFSILRLIKEKDKEAFPVKYPTYEKGLIRYICYLIEEGHKDIRGLLLSLDELKKVEKTSYTKEDFFTYVANLVFLV